MTVLCNASSKGRYNRRRWVRFHAQFDVNKPHPYFSFRELGILSASRSMSLHRQRLLSSQSLLHIEAATLVKNFPGSALDRQYGQNATVVALRNASSWLYLKVTRRTDGRWALPRGAALRIPRQRNTHVVLLVTDPANFIRPAFTE